MPNVLGPIKVFEGPRVNGFPADEPPLLFEQAELGRLARTDVAIDHDFHSKI